MDLGSLSTVRFDAVATVRIRRVRRIMKIFKFCPDYWRCRVPRTPVPRTVGRAGYRRTTYIRTACAARDHVLARRAARARAVRRTARARAALARGLARRAFVAQRVVRVGRLARGAAHAEVRLSGVWV